ncbi:MAG: pyridoxamine 5'-phosphate oxidase [Schleiferiaceae bacterium]|nr:pyridoxamine 5'-phosphate oxidase [Schleiferiaceae bacterium]
MKEKLQNTRRSYEQGLLSFEDMAANPLQQFTRWYADYEKAQGDDPNACLLSTADNQGRVTARVILLKGVDRGGFEFYTNYRSQKGRQLSENPQAALTFYWPQQERQIRIEGWVERLPEEESDGYFKSRPRGSQLGAWVSPQSEAIESRRVLDQRLKAVQAQYGEMEVVPRPPHWGGYRLNPLLMEFWQGRPGRLHDRMVYEQRTDKSWVLNRLAP